MKNVIIPGHEKTDHHNPTVVEEYGLDRHAVTPKHYYGKAEVHLMLAGIFKGAIGSGLQVAVQEAILILLPFYCAFRPGTMGPGNQSYKKRGLVS